MKSMSRDKGVIDAAVPEVESGFFKISPLPNGLSGDWTLTPLLNGSESIGADEFRVWYATNDQLLSEQQKRLAELSTSGLEFEVKRKAERICFFGQEIILHCAASDREVRLSLLKEFCRLYVRGEALDKQVAELLKSAKQDAVYTGKVDQKLLPEYGRLSEKNRQAVLARIEFSELKRELAKAAETGGGKLFAELLESSGLEDRIELIDDEIEVAEELYSVCVDRLSEFSYFWREYKAELWIILILVVELVEFFFDLSLQLPK